MAFVYEEVKEEDYNLFDSLGWKNVFEKPLRHHGYDWCKDTEREAYLLVIGSFRDETPFFCDFWYKHRIVRIDTKRRITEAENGLWDVIWNINCLYLPQSLCEEQQELLQLIEEAFRVDDEGLISKHCYGKTIVNMTNHIESIEKDYNGN